MVISMIFAAQNSFLKNLFHSVISEAPSPGLRKAFSLWPCQAATLLQ